MDAIAAFAEHVARARDDDLPAAAIEAAKALILDSLGVGVVGSAGPFVPSCCAPRAAGGAARRRASGSSGTRLPAVGAALCNAYQLHNSEFDCIHERAVVHPMAVLLPATLAHAERAGGVSGRDLLTAIVLGVDVGAGLGIASRSGLRFFRPATAGGFAATAAVGRLMGFDASDARRRLRHALRPALRHHAGARRRLAAAGAAGRLQRPQCARRLRPRGGGLSRPQQVLEGAFGYFALFEGAHDLAPVVAALGERWRVAEVALKPFPTGRATHGVLDGLLALQRQHGFAAQDVQNVVCTVPPLTARLVGRPARPGISANQARLSAPYVLACALQDAGVDVDDFSAARSPIPRLALAARIEVQADDNPDANALTPVAVAVGLRTAAATRSWSRTSTAAPPGRWAARRASPSSAATGSPARRRSTELRARR